MQSVTMDQFPDVVAMVGYLQCGVWLGFNVGTMFTIWPIILGACSAIVTGGALSILRIKFKQVKYIHFYIMCGGTVLMLLNGIIFMASEGYPTAPLYIGGIGQGAVFVSGMCYIYMHSDTRTRSSKIACANFIYLFGVAIIFWDLQSSYTGVIYSAGIYQTITSAIAILLLAVNEVLSKVVRMYDYQKSLDSDFQQENERKDGLQNALAKQDGQPGPAYKMPTSSVTIKRNTYVISLTVAVFLTKITNLILIFMGLSEIVSLAVLLSSTTYEYTVHILTAAAVGSLLAIPLSIFFSNKVIYISGVVLYSIFLLIASILFKNLNFSGSVVVFYIFYGLVGLCYYCSNTFLLEVAHIKYTELIFAAGFAIEMVIAFISNNALDGRIIYDVIDFMWANSITILVLSIIVAISGIYQLYPNTFHKPILDIQHTVLFSADFRSHKSRPSNVDTVEQGVSHDNANYQ